MAQETVVFSAEAEERVRLLEVRVELLREVVVSLTELVGQLVKPRKEQTA